LNFEAITKIGLPSQHAVGDMEIGAYQDLTWHVWNIWSMQTISMPKSKSYVRKPPSRSFAAVDCFPKKRHSRKSWMSPVYTHLKEVMPLFIKTINQFNPILKSLTKYSNI
jgi:hypothetical protein